MDNRKKIFRFVPALLVSLCILIHLIGCAVFPAPISEKSGDIEFAELLEKIRQKEKFPAIAASVIIDGTIYAKAAVGTRKVGTDNWVTIDDKFLIGSCGKAFTATLAAILINEGLLKWDTSVGEIFPEIEMHPEWERITIQQLLTNRSGYVDDSDSKLLPNEQIIPIWNDDQLPMEMRNIYMKSALNIEPRHNPDEVVIYANSCFLIAGVMLETAASKSFESLMQEKLFNPLSLSTAGYGSPATIDSMSQPYGHFSNSAIQKDFPDYISPMGNVAISIEDWTKFVLFHLDSYHLSKPVLLNSDALEKLHVPPNSATWPHSRFESWRAKAFSNVDLRTYSYAFGWCTKKEPNGNYLLYHYGQGSSFSARVIADTKKKSAILIVTNVKVDLIRLKRAAIKIRNYYSSKKELPNNKHIP